MLQLHPRKRDKSFPPPDFRIYPPPDGCKIHSIVYWNFHVKPRNPMESRPFLRTNPQRKHGTFGNLLRSRVPLFVKLWTQCDRLLLQLRNQCIGTVNWDGNCGGDEIWGGDTKGWKERVVEMFNISKIYYYKIIFKSLKLWNVELYDTIILFNLFKNVIYNKYFF